VAVAARGGQPTPSSRNAERHPARKTLCKNHGLGQSQRKQNPLLQKGLGASCLEGWNHDLRRKKVSGGWGGTRDSMTGKGFTQGTILEYQPAGVRSMPGASWKSAFGGKPHKARRLGLGIEAATDPNVLRNHKIGTSSEGEARGSSERGELVRTRQGGRMKAGCPTHSAAGDNQTPQPAEKKGVAL